MLKCAPGIWLCLFIVIVAGCSGSQQPSTDTSVAEGFDTLKASYSGMTAIGVTHTVKNYADWLKVYYDNSDPDSRISIYRSPEDPNLITVFELTHSHEDARNVMRSEQLKKVMMSAGVTSEPELHFFDVKFRVIEPTEKKFRLGVSHEVDNFDHWKKIFDQDEPVRAKANLELRAISVDADKPTQVNILFATDDIQKAKEVINSDELRNRMKEAGVKSEPVFTVYQVPE